MASRSPKAAAPRSNAQAASTSSAAGADSTGFALAQEQMQSMMSLADLVLKRAEELRRCQLETAQQTRRRHDKARADAASAANPDELLHVQSDLLRDDLESASQYWQRMASICTAAQAETLEHLARTATQLGRLAGGAASMPVRDEAPSSKGEGDDAAQAWNRWIDLGRQWSDMLYRTEAALH